jgi:hypothetical protein
VADFHVVALSKTLLVEGRGRRESFRGLVLAVGWRDPADESVASAGWGGAAAKGAPDLHYLVSDQTKPAPIWVAGSQVTSQRWFPVMTSPGKQAGDD